MAQEQIGVIHEIGDLGLGYTPLTEEEQKQIKRQDQENKDK